MRLLPTFAAAIGAALALAGSALAMPFTGPASDYYLNNYSGTIYVVRGASVVNSFATTRRGGQGEGTLAVSNVVSTRSFYGGTDSGFGWDGQAGQYSLSGTPLGGSYANDTATAGTSRVDTYDGTSDGVNNYAVEYFNSANTERVIRYDLNWQNPEVLFTTFNGTCCQQLSIAHDRRNNSLWVGGWGTSFITNYAMNGTVLSSFSAGGGGIAALGFDPADSTLWFSRGSSNQFEQWSTSGVMLQSGSIAGLPGCCFLSGDFAASAPPPPPPGVPAPGALALLGLGLLGLGRLRRRSA